MNVMGELAVLMGLAALAGAIIGWCIRNFSTSSAEKRTRQHFARDVDDAVGDARHLRKTLKSRDLEIKDIRNELQQHRSKGNSVESSTRVNVTEINKLKAELSNSKKSLLDNQSEFNTFRTERQNEIEELKRELAKFNKGGSANTERLTEANETVGALRSAVRENDKVIDSLRARVKEADTTVETLRSQLKTAESNRSQVDTVSLEYDAKLEDVTKKLGEATGTIEKQKREYDLMLENKNADIKNLHTKLEGISSSSAELQTRENEFKKRSTEYSNTENQYKSQIVDLKKTIADRDSALSKAKQQIGDLNTRVKTADQRSAQEIQKLRAEANSATDSSSKIKSKSAEVAALNDMLRDSATKRDALQSSLDELNKTMTTKDSRIRSLTTELDDVVASRNTLSSQLGELQSQGNVALEKLQQDLNQLAKTRDEYKSRIESLQGQVSDLKKSKEDQLAELRTQLGSRAQATESELKSSVTTLTNSNKALQNDVKTLQAKKQELTRSIEQQRTDLAKQVEISQRQAKKLEEREKQLTEFRSKLVREEGESQRLNSELSDAESLRLKLTEREAELRRVQIELQEAQASGPANKAAEEQLRKNDSLTHALQQRDEELSRLNSMITTNSVRNKQLQSDLNLLKEEKDSQASLIQSLETQAQNTLQLHKKIAEQSTELEDLRARLFERDNSRQPSSSATRSTVQAAANTSGLQQVETSRQTAGTKPRVFVRADTEALTGATGYQNTPRPQFTLDGHRVRRMDGSDELTLLPGVTQTIAGAFSRNGVTDFEQIALWTTREVSHYAERVGVSVQRAEQYNWPKAAKSILSGSYRKDGQGIGNS